MALISIDELKPLPPQPRFALFALGFRPFFLGAGVFAVLLVGLWLAMLGGHLSLALPLSSIQWHAHEMLFGFVGAVVGGFLLTAVRNWTGLETPSGIPLAALFLLWLSARILPFVPGVPLPVYSLVDLALFPALTLAIARPILRAKQLRNAAFPVMLGMLTLANLLVHLQWLGLTDTASLGLPLATYMIVLMMVVMGGRVIPGFTDGKLRTQAKRWKAIEWLAPATTLATLAGVLFMPLSYFTALVAALACIVHAVRLTGWYTSKYWSVPLLWVLHLGYAWIVLGFLLTALSAMEWISPALAVHAYTAGAMGTLTLGMMARVSLGHTGRMLEPGTLVAVSFALITLGAALRVLGPLAFADAYSSLVSTSGLLWIAAFAIFAGIYAPILMQSRVDGKPG